MNDSCYKKKAHELSGLDCSPVMGSNGYGYL